MKVGSKRCSLARYIASVSIASAVAFVSTIGQAHAETFCSFPGDHDPNDEQQWLDFVFKGKRFSFPAAYSDTPGIYQGGREQTGFLGRVRIPDFAPMAYADTRGKIIKGLRDWSQFLITDYLPLDVAAGRQAGNPSEENYFEKRPDDFEHRDGPFGLTEIIYERTALRNELYFDREGTGPIRALFICTPDEQVPRPDCQQLMTIDGIDVKLSYEKKDLLNWRLYVEQTRNFIHCAVRRGSRLRAAPSNNRTGTTLPLNDL